MVFSLGDPNAGDYTHWQGFAITWTIQAGVLTFDLTI